MRANLRFGAFLLVSNVAATGWAGTRASRVAETAQSACLRRGTRHRREGSQLALLSVDGHRYAVDAVVLDKDGTIVDFDALWCGWAAAVIESVAEAGGGDAQRLGEDVGVDLAAGRHLPDGPLAVGSVSDVGVILTHALYRAGRPWGAAREQVIEALRAAEPLLGERADIRPLQGVTGLLERLRALGVPCAVVTADDTARARGHLARLGFEDLLPVVIGADRVSDGGKPAPEGVLSACAELGADPRRTVLVGDSEGDMLAATAAGLAAGIRLSAGGDVSAATHTIASYEEIELSNDEQ